jgi:hypothetical protein
MAASASAFVENDRRDLLVHVDSFLLTFDIHTPSDPIPISCDDDGAILTVSTTHGLSSLPSSLRLHFADDARSLV